MEAIVQVACSSENENELALSLGDVISNVVQIDNIWFEGKLHGKQGRFKEEFVKLVPKRLPDGSLTDAVPKVIRRDEKKRKAVKALFSYAPENGDELELKVNDFIEVLEETEEFWWKGTSKGKVGMFPSNFVTEVNASNSTTLGGETALKPTGNKDAHIIPATTSSSYSSPKEARRKTNNQDEAVQSTLSTGEKRASLVLKKSPSEAPQLPPKPVREQAKVLYAYEAQNDDELTLKEGDTISVISKEVEDKGWWKGELNNKIGVFPDNFVELIKSEEVILRKPERPDKPIIRSMPPKELPEKIGDHKRSSKIPPSKPPPPEILKKDEKPERPFPPHSVKKPQVPPPMKKPLRTSLGALLSTSPSNSVSSPPVDSTTVFSYKSSSPEDSKIPFVPNELNEKKVPDSQHEFDLLEVSTDKLMHVTASRVKFPNRRPPSHIFLKDNEKDIDAKQIVIPKETEETPTRTKLHIKESKELKVCKPIPISGHEEKPKVPPYRPALPAQLKANLAKAAKPEHSAPMVPQHAVQVQIPSSETSTPKMKSKVKEETNTFHMGLSQLKNEAKHLEEFFVPKSEYDELVLQVNELKIAFEAHKDDCQKQIQHLKSELEKEKKLRISMQTQ